MLFSGARSNASEVAINYASGVCILTLIRAISYTAAFVPAEESLGCFLTQLIHLTPFADFQMGKMQAKRA